MSATQNRAQPSSSPKPDSLRSVHAGAIWTGLPAREQHLLLWLLGADIVTAELASLLVYRQLRTAQRRLARLVELGLLRGFWSASAHRPRGRYAYVLTRATRIDIERLAWPHGRPDRPPDLPSSAPIHELATLDVFAAFLRQGDPLLGEGIFTWVPERICGHVFGGFLRPDGLAGIRVGDRAIALFVERDLGTERGEVLAEKIRRYRSVFARTPDLPVNVGFVVDSERRARAVHELVSHRAGPASQITFLTAIAQQLHLDPLHATWTDGRVYRPTRDLAAISTEGSWPVITPGCLSDGEAIAALDDRGLTMLPELLLYVR
ncbi:MAG: replication-relaxation family protein [Chloroflexi bacterium]|nr:replication-relaxation family protein [Chloroflexota bacterium]